jgi:hypothetical protein
MLCVIDIKVVVFYCSFPIAVFLLLLLLLVQMFRIHQFPLADSRDEHIAVFLLQFSYCSFPIAVWAGARPFVISRRILFSFSRATRAQFVSINTTPPKILGPGPVA